METCNHVPDDAELIQCIVDGDATAADLLVDRYQQMLFSFLCRLSTNQADAEDIFQEVWLRVIRYCRSFQKDKKFKSWLFQIAVNCTRDYFSQRRTTMPMLEDIATEQPHDWKRLEDRELARTILGKVPLPQREVLLLRYFHDMKEKEIAVVLNIPIGTVKSRLHNILHYLKEFYGSDHE